MKKCLAVCSAALLAVFMVVGSAFAEPTVQQILNDLTIGGDSHVNANTDFLADGSDAYWEITASGGSFATMIIEIAGLANSNTFGVFNGNQYVQLFNGAATGGSQATLSIKLDGSVWVNLADTGIDFASNVFGYYLGVGNTKYLSDSTLNVGNEDHMRAYQGNNIDTLQIADLAPGLWTNNEYILAWEDLSGAQNSDWDYNDMLIMVESVNPKVPVPAAVWLLGSGVVGLIGLRRKMSV